MTEQFDERLRLLLKQGSRFVAREHDGWGAAASSLPVLMKRLRGSTFTGIYKIHGRADSPKRVGRLERLQGPGSR